MALGVNAHVNNDLPFSLSDAEVTANFSSDYFKVNELISGSIDEVITSLQEDSTLLNVTENTLTDVYSFLLNTLIQRWRKHAWENCFKLQNNQITAAEISQQAYTVALKLKDVKQLIELPKLFAIA
jgi:hypothetical protein